MSCRSALVALTCLVWLSAAADPARGPPAVMSAIVGKDVSAKVLKKLALPSRNHCWDACVQEERCSGVRWGVIERDTAGLCILLSGPLTLKSLSEPRTDDGRTIHVSVARKDTDARRGT